MTIICANSAGNFDDLAVPSMLYKMFIKYCLQIFRASASGASALRSQKTAEPE